MIIPEDVLLSSVYHKSWCLPIKSSLPDYCILLCSSIVYNDYFLFCHAVARVIEICCVHTPARLCAPSTLYFAIPATTHTWLMMRAEGATQVWPLMDNMNTYLNTQNVIKIQYFSLFEVPV